MKSEIECPASLAESGWKQLSHDLPCPSSPGCHLSLCQVHKKLEGKTPRDGRPGQFYTLSSDWCTMTSLTPVTLSNQHWPPDAPLHPPHLLSPTTDYPLLSCSHSLRRMQICNCCSHDWWERQGSGENPAPDGEPQISRGKNLRDLLHRERLIL